MSDFIPFEHQVHYDEDSGFRGLRQIYYSLRAMKSKYADEIFVRYSNKYLDRCYMDWKKDCTPEEYNLFIEAYEKEMEGEKE